MTQLATRTTRATRATRVVVAVLAVTGTAIVWTLWLSTGGPRAWLGTATVVVAGVAAIVVLMRRSVPRPSRRVVAYAVTTALTLSALLAVAASFRLSGGLAPLLGDPRALALGVVSVIGLAFWLCLVVTAVVAVGHALRGRRVTRVLAERSALQPQAVAALLLVLWAPALVALLPGSVTYDGARQLNEWWRTPLPMLDFVYSPTNHHPWFATVWQGSLVSAGMALSDGDVNVGLLVHTLVLVAASLATYTVVVLRVQEIGNRAATLGTIVFFGVIPHFANYAALFEKTGWYQLALVWFYLGVVEVVRGRGRLAVRAAQLIAGGMLTALFRSNGVYIVLGTLVVVGLCSLRRGDRRRLALAAASAIVVALGYVGWTNVALPRMGVSPASPAEALVVPLQQVARIVVEHGTELSQDERQAIGAVMPLDVIPQAYAPENGDGVKGLYEVDSFLITEEAIRAMQTRGEWWLDPSVDTDRARFLATWADLVRRYPATAVAATAANTYLYVAPTMGRGADVSLFTGGLPDYEILANEYTGRFRHLAGEGPNTALGAIYLTWARVPVMSMLVNPGLYGWVVVALALSLVFWPRSSRLMLLSTPLLVFLVNFAGARNGDFRYTVPLLALLPVCLAAWLSSRAVGSSVRARIEAEEGQATLARDEREPRRSVGDAEA